MSDERRLTDPTLRALQRYSLVSDAFADASRGEDRLTPPPPARSTALSWIGDWLHCRFRRKEWRTVNKRTRSSTSQQLAAIAAKIAGKEESKAINNERKRVRRSKKYSKDFDEEEESKNPLTLDFSWLTSSTVADTFKVLLAFPRNDQQSEILGRVVRKLGWRVSEAKNAQEAGELFPSELYDLAIVDRRGTVRCQEADQICRILNKWRSTKSCNIVALVKKSFFTAPNQDEFVILHLLNIGYDQALMECSHEGILMNELIGIYAGESHPKNQLVTAQLLYLAVDRCRDIIHVTNDQGVVQFANRASEKLLGYEMDELIGRKITDFLTNESLALIDERLEKGREFEANISWKRKFQGVLNINCQVISMKFLTSKTVHYVYMYDSINDLQILASSKSFHQYSTSTTVQPQCSDKGRQSNLAKIHNWQLESKITKVIEILSKAMKKIKLPELSAEIESAIDILRNTGLYLQHQKDDGSFAFTDPVTTHSLKNLMSVPQREERKSSSISTGSYPVVSKILYSNHHLTKDKIFQRPMELEELLETSFDWNFDIFKLEILSNKRPLFYLGMRMMTHYRVAERLGCDERTLQNWLITIENNYHSNVYYHNSTHATDVLQATACFMHSKQLQKVLDPLDEVATLIAAASHDIGHPGKSSQFLCNSSHILAILYNDLSVLESHHAALTFKVTLSDENVNIFKKLNKELYKSIRQTIIDMILATEMTKHFEHLARFVQICSQKSEVNQVEALSMDLDDTSILLLPENVTLTKRMMIKCADVSNPTRPFRLYLEWTRRIAEEYFSQTDEEKRRKMPVVMPIFDRSTCSIPQSQIGFVDYIINDMMEAWDAFIDMPELIGYMRQNYHEWKNLYEHGITTLENIVELQVNPEFQLYKGNE